MFSTKPAEAAAAAKQQGLTTGNINAGADLTAGQGTADALYGQAHDAYGQARSTLNGASDAYGNLMTSTGRGSDAYGDATGANGAEGLARAKALYQADPGYNGGLTTGIDQLDRTAAQRGDLGGGNTAADTIKFASDYDNKKYSNYVSSLAPYLGANAGAVAGKAGVIGQQANTYGQDASTYGTQAGADLGVAGQRATNDYNTASGVGNAKADAALAPYSASSNFWSALMGLGKMGAQAYGGSSKGGASAGASVGSDGSNAIASSMGMDSSIADSDLLASLALV